ncbi:unnamed protein product [Acanthoscelides obtectus]|uniref:Uncharacterized protein n=1 Tax=Acanthoscelides obtectus TaxID=200917 RepID=A0A9P0KS29_ACAOB|nr:unnamed protein product [Acanthoscelides obtectus]CAK1663038.1 hypothetical protein AOBTE_LOCUS23446 [Acanthoscelides obtectus]
MDRVDNMEAEIQSEISRVGYAKLAKVHTGLDAASSSSCDSGELDEEYYRNQPPPLNYESIKENVVKIDDKQHTDQSQRVNDDSPSWNQRPQSTLQNSQNICRRQGGRTRSEDTDSTEPDVCTRIMSCLCGIFICFC